MMNLKEKSFVPSKEDLDEMLKERAIIRETAEKERLLGIYADNVEKCQNHFNSVLEKYNAARKVVNELKKLKDLLHKNMDSPESYNEAVGKWNKKQSKRENRMNALSLKQMK